MPDSNDAARPVVADADVASAATPDHEEPESPAGDTKAAAPRLIVPRSLFDTVGTPEFETSPVDIAEGRRVPSLEVGDADAGALANLLSGKLRLLVSSQKLPEADRAWACLHLLRRAVEQTHAEKKVDAAGLRTASEGMGALLAAVEPMRALSAHHLSTNADLVERAVDTAFYAGVLAAASGSRDRRNLTDVVLAGALADVGKLELPPELLESTSPLNDRDWELVRWHPHHSVEWLRAGGISDASVLRGVAAHHERWSGGGYPYDLSGETIPTEARYVAIADAFGALCIARPHQESNTAFEALGKMATSGQFEPRLVRTLIQLLKSDETDESDEGDSVPVATAA